MELAGWGKLACFRAQKYAIQYPQIALFSPQIKYVSSPFHILLKTIIAVLFKRISHDE